MNYLPFSLSTFDKEQVTTFSSDLDAAPSKKIALVVQGGGQRGIFTAGVLDSFLEHQFDPFAMYIGTSAGALNLSSYISRQYRFGYQFIQNYTTTDKFFSLYKYLSKQQPMNLDWALQVVSPSGELPLDFITAKKTLRHREAFACATRKDTLEDIYMPMYREDWREVLRASCAIPVLYNLPVNLNDLEWVDGGVSAAVPVKEAWRRGADLVVVIRTEPLEHEQEEDRGIFDDWRESVELYLPYYMNKLSLNESVDRIKTIHQELTGRFEHWREQYRKDEVIDEKQRHIQHELTHLETKSDDKVKESIFGNKSWLSHINIERLLKLAGQSNNIDVIEMLAQYYKSYQEVSDFLIDPPKGLQVIQIAPEKSLNSRALLSSDDDLEIDYREGKIIGRKFLHSFSQILNERSSLMQYLREE
ncbi:patatin-like phospholipase family protein [Photobacterium leiognathi]|uniref:patatin-like phospholipase family protein n=1 Tax=Photobacterium leiognathi TaxID=553611 RepID=UPI002982316A|nr:patatin-like phospholipase family protein [Photobacterium leiognathi]